MAGAIPGARLLIVPCGHGDYLGEQAAGGGDLRTKPAAVPAAVPGRVAAPRALAQDASTAHECFLVGKLLVLGPHASELGAKEQNRGQQQKRDGSVGGDQASAQSLKPIFGSMGTTVRYMGASGSGAPAKACNQIVVAATVTAVSEALLLARSGGPDLAVMLELLQGGLADSVVLRQKG